MQDWTIHRFSEIDSTSTWLKTRPDNGQDVPTLGGHKTVAVADFQTAGRGRLGRKWQAEPGTALMFSMLLRPNWPIERGSWLTMIAGLAAAETLETISESQIQLKWPNDVVVMNNGILHKMGGILQEAETSNGRLSQVIIGIGLNINMSADQLPPATHTPACSLQSITGRTFDRNLILTQLLQQFDALMADAEQGNSPHEAWQSRLVTLDQQVTATLLDESNPSTKIEGTAVGVDEWGRLLIKTTSGTVEKVIAGDVTLRT